MPPIGTISPSHFWARLYHLNQEYTWNVSTVKNFNWSSCSGYKEHLQQIYGLRWWDQFLLGKISDDNPLLLKVPFENLFFSICQYHSNKLLGIVQAWLWINWRYREIVIRIQGGAGKYFNEIWVQCFKPARGWPSCQKLIEQKNKRVGPKTIMLFKEVRLNGIGQIPTIAKRALRCKYSACDARRVKMCKKCNVYICVFQKTCFQDFHCI